ncbi:MAG TPA: secretin N-terminal domain-containing protein [Pirellulales bacterium]|nr:secretin N-terminal domain-containing protein [Pirellulales bacterium]
MKRVSIIAWQLRPPMPRLPALWCGLPARCPLWCGLPARYYGAAMLLALLVALPAPAQEAQGPPQDPPRDGTVRLNFPAEVEVKVLVDYVSQRLAVKILYDEQIANKKVSIKGPGEIPVSSLLGLLESALKMKGMALEDAEVEGWKRIVTTAKLPLIARNEKDAQAAIDKYGAATAVTQAFLLKHADPTQVDTVIKPFLTQPGANSVAIKDPSVLIVTDYAANVLKIAKLVRLMDEPKPDVVFELVAVKNVEASAFSQQLSALLTARAKARGNTAGTSTAAEVAFDARTNMLMVIGTREQVAEVLDLVESFDVPLGLSTHVYELRFASAQRLERLVKDLIDPIDAKRLFRSSVDEDGNLLIVSTTDAIHARIAAIQRRLDAPSAKGRSFVRFYKLKNVNAADVLETIRAMDGKSDPQAANAPGANGAANKTGGGPAAGAGPTAPAGGMGGMAGGMGGMAGGMGGMGGGMGGMAGGMGGGQNAPNQAGPRAAQGANPGRGARQGAARAQSLSVETSDARVTADTNTNSIIVMAEPAVQDVYAELIVSLDRRRPQVLIEAKVVTIDTSDSFTVGIELSPQHKGLLAFTSQGLSTVDPVSGALSLLPGVGFNGALVDPNAADIVLRSLASHSRAKVLSAPRILVNDNATGVLTSVSEVPFTSVNASQTVATTSFAGFAKAGTTITVTPHIGEGDHVQLEYTVTLNSFTGAGANGVPPPRQTDEVDSKVVVPDGHTIIVGGLNRQNDSKSINGPVHMENIPVLKYLFTNRSKSKQSTSMFVFLRPIILRDDKFHDLKFLSTSDEGHAEMPGDLPRSEPILMK